MKLNDVVLEAASPAQQAAIAISMKKAGKKPKQGVAEGSEESYIIVRTDSEGKKDVFAGNFDTYEQAQKELDGLLAHPLHTKYKQKFEIKRKGGEQGVAEANIQPTSAASRSHIGNLSNPVTNSVVHPSSGKEIGLITMQPTGEYYAQPTSTALANSQGGTFATKDEAHQFIRNAHAKAIKNGTLSDKWLKKQPLPQFAKGQGVAEGKADYNFDIEDLKRLEQIRDLSTLKAQALALISKPSAKPMKPEKVEWFKNALERMNSPLKVIKLMYDLLLSGEGKAVVGTKSSMNPNSYRQRFGEQGMAEDANLNYIWIQGDFDGDTASSGVTQGSWRDQQSTPVKLTRGRMTNVRPLSGPPPEGGKTIKQAQIPLTLDAGKEKFSTTGVDLQLTVAPNGYITNGEVGRVRGTAVVKIMRPESVEEDLTRRGFLRGLGMAAAGAAGLGAAGAAQARAPGEWQAKVERAKALMAKGQSREQTARIMGIKGPNPGGAGPMSGDWGAVNYAAQEMRVKEEYNPEYDDEAGMADNNLETLQRAVEGIDDLIQSGDNLPEWCQEKIAVAKSMLVAVWDYMYSEEASDEVDPEVDEMFEAMQELVAEMAVKNRVSEDLVWEQFEAMPDNVLYETAAWRRKEGKSKKGGLNAKGVASYRRENPGSKLQMAVTTKPSKLKKGSKASKRRKSFCARMSGVKGPMKKPNGKPTRKALALRKWNC